MTVRTYTTHEQVDASGSLDSLLILLTLLLQVRSVTVKNMHILFLDIDM